MRHLVARERESYTIKSQVSCIQLMQRGIAWLCYGTLRKEVNAHVGEEAEIRYVGRRELNRSVPRSVWEFFSFSMIVWRRGSVF